jgi:hypothetical protein
MKIGLTSCWALSHAAFGLLLISTRYLYFVYRSLIDMHILWFHSLVTTTWGATIIFTLQGLCSVVSHWIPFVIVSSTFSLQNIEPNSGQIAIAAHDDASKISTQPDEQGLTNEPDIELESLLEHSADSTVNPKKTLAGDAPNRVGFFLVCDSISYI